MSSEEIRTAEDGEYRLLVKLGEGTAGEVYLAVKITSPQDIQTPEEQNVVPPFDIPAQ
jgi:hypothetical protein